MISQIMIMEEWRSLSPESRHKINLLGSKLEEQEALIKQMYEALKKGNREFEAENNYTLIELDNAIEAAETLFPELKEK